MNAYFAIIEAFKSWRVKCNRLVGQGYLKRHSSLSCFRI